MTGRGNLSRSGAPGRERNEGFITGIIFKLDLCAERTGRLRDSAGVEVQPAERLGAGPDWRVIKASRLEAEGRVTVGKGNARPKASGYLPLMTRPLFLCVHVKDLWSKRKAFLLMAGAAGEEGIHFLISPRRCLLAG